MSAYRCPLCTKPLTKDEYEKALKIQEAREEHLRAKEEALRKEKLALRETIKKQEEKARQQERDRTDRLLKGRDQEIERLQRTIRQLREGSTPQTEGLEFEETLADRLQREFPDDEIEHAGRGGDIVHTVRSDTGRPAGIIVYECKNGPKQISSQHIQQAYRAKQTRKAAFAVLVTTGRRRGYSGFATMNEVFVLAPLCVVPLVAFLRLHLLEMQRAELTGRQRAVIAERLKAYIESTDFKNLMEEMIRTLTALETDLKDEIKTQVRFWRKRWERYQTIRWDAGQIVGNVRRILDGKEPAPLTAPKLLPLSLPGVAA